MRTLNASLYAVMSMALCPAMAVTQASVPLEATDHEAIVLEGMELAAALEVLQLGEGSSQRIIEGGDVFSVTLLHRSAPTATIHGYLSDLYVIKEGSATLVTGGSLVDPEPANRPGDQRGSAIRGGTERTVSAGDVVFIPPEMAHGFRAYGESGSITYLNIHFPWRR